LGKSSGLITLILGGIGLYALSRRGCVGGACGEALTPLEVVEHPGIYEPGVSEVAVPTLRMPVSTPAEFESTRAFLEALSAASYVPWTPSMDTAACTGNNAGDDRAC